MDEKYLITESQLEKLEEELNYNIHTKRVEIIERIKEAKSFGDLSENSEYDSAREEQGFIESKIAELENLIKNSELIADKIGTDSVSLGNRVTYENIKTKTKYTYRIVGINANPFSLDDPRISTQTPIAKALLGRAKNDQF